MSFPILSEFRDYSVIKIRKFLKKFRCNAKPARAKHGPRTGMCSNIFWDASLEYVKYVEWAVALGLRNQFKRVGERHRKGMKF